MPLGVRYQLEPIQIGDTAELDAALHENGVPLTAEEVASVLFSIQAPNLEVHGPFSGEILEDGKGYYQWVETSEVGEYLVKAQFTTTAGAIKTVMLNFTVEDPYDLTPLSPEDIVIEDVWMRLEDCFDSVEGGPWLRDITRSHFDEIKVGRYINETLLDINVQMPPSNVPISEFTQPQGNGAQNELLPILSKGVLCKVIQHLIRSYVEQPVPQGAQIVYEDRTRYKDAWKAVYDQEHEDYITMVRLWKRGMLNLGHSALLVLSKAGRLFPYSNFRTQNVGRRFF